MHYRIMILLLVGVALLGFEFRSLGQPAAADPLPPKALSLAQHQVKIADGLMALALSANLESAPFPASAFDPNADFNSDGVRVVIEPQGGSAAVISDAALRALGARVEARSNSLLRARVPLDKLEALAQLPAVRYVRRPHSFQVEDFPTSQAITPLGATLYHSFGAQGQGIKVAVIDIGFASLEYAKQRGALPESAIADFEDYTGQRGLQDNHGTAVALIVHEVAPQAQLYLKQVVDEVSLENAVDDAIAQGVHIINHSVGWNNSNFSDGTGFFAELAQRAQGAGILWVNAAGNHAQNHWAGRLVDADGDRWADFPGSIEQSLRLSAYFGIVTVSLTWDDWPLTSQDLDLYLYNSQGQAVASSTQWQTGSEPPVEGIEYVVEKPDLYYIKVLARRAYGPLRIKVFTDQGHPLFPSIPHGSLLAPADAPAALSVGAVSIAHWPDGPQQPFSSLGPTSDGRTKPDLVAPDDVHNLLLHPFTGTSAAAPHVAGAAALLWSSHPQWDVFQVRAALESQTRDLGFLGKDPIYGAGALDLALVQLSATRTLSAAQVEAGGSLMVTVTTQVPAMTFAQLELRESVPKGWVLSSDDRPFEPATQRWFWPMLQPGQRADAHYTLTIPAGQAPGVYTLRGLANGAPIQGDAQIEVLPSSVRGGAGMGAFQGGRTSPLQVQRLSHAVQFQSRSAFTLTLYDLAGQQVYQTSTQTRAMRWNGLTHGGRTAANGVYIAVAHFSDGSAQAARVLWFR
ncbi:MAG TPA: S8 family serine peptidase [Candidatus Bipolaricaulota bacterium]